MSNLQQQARALGDPTRHEVFRYVADADRPIDVSELTEYFGLNHNAIRQHLAKLVDAELLIETTAKRGGRGRPRLVYELDPAAESLWGVEGPYERLSLWLSEIIVSGESPVDVGRRVGRRQELGDGADPVDELVHQMARQGFDPTVTQRGSNVDVTLRTCPFATTALADPDTVCELHLGIAYGIADGLTGLEVDELISKDPRRAHCRLHAHVEP